MNFNPNDVSHVRKWLTFNDSTVSHFNLDQLESECFGGNNNGKEDFSDSLGWNKKNDWDNSKNAYMLVYERIKKCPITLVIPEVTKDSEKFEEFLQIKKANDQIISYKNSDKYKLLKNINRVISGFSLDCDDTVISRRDIDPKKIYDYVFFNEENEEFSYYIPFYKYINKDQRLLPLGHMKEVLVDNLLFLNDQNIFCAEFSDFLDKAVGDLYEFYVQENNNINHSNSSKQDNKELYKNIFDILLGYALNILSKASSKDSLGKLISNIIKFLEILPEFSLKCLEKLCAERDLLVEILFSSEENANLAYKSLVYHSILNYAKFFKEEIEQYKILKCQDLEKNLDWENNDSQYTSSLNEIKNIPSRPIIYQLLDRLLALIPVDVSKMWNKMLAFLELFEAFANSNNEIILDYLFENEIIFKLIDLALGKESPYYKKGDSRNEIGNRLSVPKFTPLLNAVSILTRRCFTGTWTKEAYEADKNYKPPLLITLSENQEKIYSLSERDLECLYQRSFLKKCIKDNYNNTALSKLLAHLMFDNFEYSKKRVFMIMEAVNDGISLADAKAACELIFNVSNIDDRFSIIRLEWIFGIPQLQLKPSDTCLPRIVKNGDRYSDKIYKYISSILYGTTHESFIERVIYKYQASADFITILNYFFSIIYKNPYTFMYFDALPHPKEEGLKLKDYIFSLANEELNRIFNITNSESKFENSIKGITNIMQNYNDKKEEFLNSLEEEYKQGKFKFDTNYKIGEIHSEKIALHENNCLSSNNLYAFVIDYVNTIEGEEEALNIEFSKEKSNDSIENILAKKDETDSENRINHTEQENVSENINDYLDDEETNATEKQLPNKATRQSPEQGQNISAAEEAGNDRNEYADSPSCDQENRNEHNNSKCAIQGDDDNNEENPEQNVIVLTNKQDKIGNMINLLDTNSNNENADGNSYQDNKHNDNDDKLNKKDEKEAYKTNLNSYVDATNNNEDVFFKKNINNLIKDGSFVRSISISSRDKNPISQNCIKRIVLYNNSDNDYKVRFSYFSNDDFENFYLPKSDIVVIAKKNSVTNVNTFVKYDYMFPWNEFSFNVDCEYYETGNNYSDNRYKDSNNLFKKSKSSSNVKDNNVTDGYIGPLGILNFIFKNFYFINVLNSSALPAPDAESSKDVKDDIKDNAYCDDSFPIGNCDYIHA